MCVLYGRSPNSPVSARVDGGKYMIQYLNLKCYEICPNVPIYLPPKGLIHLNLLICQGSFFKIFILSV